MLGEIMRRKDRWDVGLDLEDQIVVRALAAFGRPLVSALGAARGYSSLRLVVDEVRLGSQSIRMCRTLRASRSSRSVALQTSRSLWV